MTSSALARRGHLLAVVVLAAALLVALPTTGRAHTVCGPLDGLAASVARAVEAVNVFAPVVDTSTTACPDQFDAVQEKGDRDFALAGHDNRAFRASEAGQKPPPPGKGGGGGNGGCNGKKRDCPPPEPPDGTCTNGVAADQFACDGIDLVGHVSLNELGLSRVNDTWGWTDPSSNRDYALVGGIEGMVVVDITTPDAPVTMGILPSASRQGSSSWRDIKVHANHAFVGSEHTGHGVQVFDLTRLRTWNGSYTTWSADARYTGVGSTHNLAVNTETGFLYAVGSSTNASLGCGSGLHMVNVANPTAPTYAGCFDLHGYVHDTQCVVYDGSDTQFQGRELCFSSAPGIVGLSRYNPSVSIVDVTDKSNPVALADIPYDGGTTDAYSHQGWLSSDQSTFYHGDELDETNGGVARTTTRLFDLADVDAPRQLGSFVNDTTSIDHNMYVEGSRMYQSNYTSGLRVLDVSAQAAPVEVAWFDLYPENDAATFEGGTWSNYPYFAQADIVTASSIDRGLFVLRTTA